MPNLFSGHGMDAMLLDVGKRKVGPGQPCFFIAEAGVNHNGSIDIAERLIDAAVDAGADAVKFQTFKAGGLATPDAPKASYQQRTTCAGESQFEMLRRLELTLDNHRHLIDYCERRGIEFLSTPFEEASAVLLVGLGVPALKIPSGEVTNLPFLAHVARLGLPLIVSTGMCDLGEVEAAVETIVAEGNDSLLLLHCVSNYPACPGHFKFVAMATMQAAFGVPCGYSDHTLGNEVSLAAVALGACVIEKHFTLDRAMPGPDHEASLEPGELKELVQGIRVVESALGSGRKKPAASERDTAVAIRKSLVAAQDIAAGQTFTEELIAVKRPGTGLPPGMKGHVIGRIAAEHIPAGALLDWGKVA